MSLAVQIAIAVIAFVIGRMSVMRPYRNGMLLVALAALTSFRAGIQADLSKRRVAFETKHRAEIRALTLTPAEMATIKPRKG